MHSIVVTPRTITIYMYNRLKCTQHWPFWFISLSAAWYSHSHFLYFFSFSFSIKLYCQTLLRVLSTGVLCTLWVARWKPTSNHILLITVEFFNLHRGWLSLNRGHPVTVPIRRTMHLSSVIPVNDTRESVFRPGFRHQNFSHRERGLNLEPLAPEA